MSTIQEIYSSIIHLNLKIDGERMNHLAKKIDNKRYYDITVNDFLNALGLEEDAIDNLKLKDVKNIIQYLIMEYNFTASDLRWITYKIYF